MTIAPIVEAKPDPRSIHVPTNVCSNTQNDILPADNNEPIIQLLQNINDRLARLEQFLISEESTPAALQSTITGGIISSADVLCPQSLATRFIRSIPSRAIAAARNAALRQLQSFAITTVSSLLMFLWIRKLRKVFLKWAILLLFKTAEWTRQENMRAFRKAGQKALMVVTRILQ
ncbi:hypothetical protein SpCBS45565_g08321 [Spizellomyces sp. 'palustris']|nr:hypothetical protein SpCBS45565_g08321 [Spizellomyces sp. 'palustris']